MEIKEGMYVRTKQGKIGKIIDINLGQEEKRYILDSSSVYIYCEEDISKASHNIIDLIEVGDYVNGNRVDFTNSNNKLSYEDKCIGFYDGNGDITLFEKDIKSIVTKEQFESMSYKVGE